MWALGLVVLGFALGRPAEPEARKPPMSQWTVSDVRTWVESLGPAFVPYGAKFEEKCVNGNALRTITDSLLESIGISDPLLKHRILTDIKTIP